MITSVVQTSRRWIVALIVAAIMALTIAYGPVFLTEVAGVSASTPAYACNPPGAGC